VFFFFCGGGARRGASGGLRDIDAEERSDVSVRSLNERSLLG